MSKVVVKLNLSCGNKLSYFSEQWKNHLRSKDMDLMTDVTFVGLGSDRDGFKSVKVHKAVILTLCPVLNTTALEANLVEDPVYLFPEDSVDIIKAFVQFIYEGYFILKDPSGIKSVLSFMERVGLILPPRSFHISSLVNDLAELAKCDTPVTDVNYNIHHQEKEKKEDPGAEQPQSDVQIKRQTTRKQSGTIIKAPLKFDPSQDRRTKTKHPSLSETPHDLQKKEATFLNSHTSRSSSARESNCVTGLKSLGDNHVSIVDGQVTVKGPDEKEAVRISELLISGQAEIGTIEGKQVLIQFSPVVKNEAMIESQVTHPSSECKQKVSQNLESAQSTSEATTVKFAPDNKIGGEGTKMKIEYRKTPFKHIGNGEKRPKRSLRTKAIWNSKIPFHSPKYISFKTAGSGEQQVPKSKSSKFKLKCMFCDFKSKSLKDLTIHCDLNHPKEIYRCSDCNFEADCYAKLKFHRYRCKNKNVPKNDVNGTLPIAEEVTSPIPTSTTTATNADSEFLPDLAPCVKNKNSGLDISEGDVLTCVKRKLSFSDKDAVGKDSPDIEILESNVKSACPPGPNLSSRDSNKPIMKLACPVASCDLKVPIFQDETSSETAQEIIYNHQRQVHNLSEPNLSTQVIMDTVVDVYYLDQDSTKSLNNDFQLQLSDDIDYEKPSKDATQAHGIWENNLRNYWESCKRDTFKGNEKIVPLIPDFVSKTAGDKKEIKVECKIGKLSCVGDGDSDIMAREDAAYSMLLQLKFIVAKNDEKGVEKIICN